MIGRAVVFSSVRNGGSDDWKTPEKVLKAVRRIAPIALDPCSTRGNPTRAAVYWYRYGLTYNWCIFAYSGLVFVNPPYSRCADWIAKIISETNNPANRRKIAVVALVPSRTDQPWYQRSMETAQLVCFVKGRLRFIGATNGAPFPSTLFYWGPNARKAILPLTSLGATMPINHHDPKKGPLCVLLPMYAQSGAV